MNYRLNSKVIALVALLVLVAVSLFIYTLVSTPANEELAETPTQEEGAQPEDMIVNGKHQYADNMHTIAGKVTLPTPCHSVVVEPFFVDGDSGTSTVELRFTTVLEGEECPSVVSDAPYRVTFEAPQDIAITAVWDGKPVRLNLVPVAEGESLDEEFYFKG